MGQDAFFGLLNQVTFNGNMDFENDSIQSANKTARGLKTEHNCSKISSISIAELENTQCPISYLLLIILYIISGAELLLDKSQVSS